MANTVETVFDTTAVVGSIFTTGYAIEIVAPSVEKAFLSSCLRLLPKCRREKAELGKRAEETVSI